MRPCVLSYMNSNMDDSKKTEEISSSKTIMDSANDVRPSTANCQLPKPTNLETNDDMSTIPTRNEEIKPWTIDDNAINDQSNVVRQVNGDLQNSVHDLDDVNITNTNSTNPFCDDMDSEEDSDTEISNEKLLPGNNGDIVPQNSIAENNTATMQVVTAKPVKLDENTFMKPDRSLVKKERFSDIRLYLVNYCFLLLFYMSQNIYNIGVIRTIERKYGLRSAQSGFIMSTNDISHIMVVIFVGYFGKKAHKPRYLSISLLLCAVAAILMASPYFIFGENPISTSPTPTPPSTKPLALESHPSNLTHPTYMYMDHVAGVVASSDDPGYCDPDRPDYQCSDEEIEQDSANMAAYYIMLAAQVIYIIIYLLLP